jgi:hypothetical protein
MNLAKAYLETAYPDSLFTRDSMEKLEAAGQLRWATMRLMQLESAGESFAQSGASPVDAALELEAQEMAQFIAWREELVEKTNDPGLREVPLIFADLDTPQAVTVHQIDNSNAIALDRRMTSFLGALTTWAYLACGLEQNGADPIEARSTFMRALADHVLLNYSKLPLSSQFEMQELQIQQVLGKANRAVIRQGALLAAKFVLYHELGHVHLKHFDSGQASRVGADNSEISAFLSIDMEFEADAFAQDHLTDPNGSVTAAIVAKVAGTTYCLLLAMKEAMLPGKGEMAETMTRDHPPSFERAAKLRQNDLPPAYMPEWAPLLGVPELLGSLYQNEGFKEAARRFASRAASAT